MKYTLYVNDNGRYMDEEARYTVGDFDSLEKAITIAKGIVDKFLNHAYKEGMTRGQLWEQYMFFGEDPFIAGGPPYPGYSSWDYARKRCNEICSSED